MYAVNYETSNPDKPPSYCRKCIKHYYQQPEISLSGPQQLTNKNPINTKKTKKNNFFDPGGFREFFFRQKMPISSNFHLSPNQNEKLNFSTYTQFISLEQDKIIQAHKNPLVLTEKYPLTIFPIQFPDFFLINFFRISIQAISISLITTIKFSIKNSTQKYNISGTTSQFSHFF